MISSEVVGIRNEEGNEIGGKEEKNKYVDVKKEIKRKYKKNDGVFVLDRKKAKFFVDVSKDKKAQEVIFNLLEKVNKKQFGRVLNFKDIVLFALGKLTAKDLEKIQENSLSEMEKVERACKEFNKKNKTKFTLGEFLLKKLNLN